MCKYDNIQLEHNVVIKAKKSKNGYQLLGLLFGVFGLHDLYAGYYKIAFIYFISHISYIFNSYLVYCNS